MALAVVSLSSLRPAFADAAAEGRALYAKHCARCHGAVKEAAAGARPAARLLPAVMTPLGPGLTGIYGRTAGTVPGYRYSNAFRAAAEGLVWDATTLGPWIADSQAMIRGSYMFVRVPAPERRRIVRYLETYARAPDDE